MEPFSDLESAPLHLSEVRLERFKAAFKPGPITLQPFNLVIGRNGSGKSTLLEALQWIDATLRRDAREASSRYFGSGDLVNLRSRTSTPYFRLTLRWSWSDGFDTRALRYSLTVEDRAGLPHIVDEELCTLDARGAVVRPIVTTSSLGRTSMRKVSFMNSAPIHVSTPDRLALGIAISTQEGSDADAWIRPLRSFWERAVFLRLSPNRLAKGSPATRASHEPLLDEEGQTLPALLSELNDGQRAALVSAIGEILPGIRGVSVSRAELGRDALVNYSLEERMPHRGRSGRLLFPIPAWMLSEGTRRITAILALLHREPPPTLLCIEEVENGLDPWTTREVLSHLQSAAENGVQVILTSHSPWLLDHVDMGTILQVRRVDGDTRYDRFVDRPEVMQYAPSVPAGTRYVNEAE